MNMDKNQLIFAKAIAHDVRQEVMQQLCCVWLNVNDLVDKLDGKVNQPTVSHHLKILEEAGLVHIRKEGKYRYYTLNQEQVTTCCGMLLSQFAPDFVEQVIDMDAIPVVK